MSSNDLNDSTLSRLSDAADWLQRLHEFPDDQMLLGQCQRWLDAAAENADAFERMEAVWQAVGRLARSSTAASGICSSARLSTRVAATPLPPPARISRPPAQA